jgi:copper homeostasis protein
LSSVNIMDRSQIGLEICIDSLAGARAAIADGADRLEVCACLEFDGLSPDPELIESIRAESALPLMAMVRPRPTDFVLQAGEWDELARELERAAESKLHGAVLGFLTEKGEIPDQELGRLIERAQGSLQLTFHRAFDHSRNPYAALCGLAALGFQRVLTSGRPGKAVQHLPLLAELAALAASLPGELTVLPGGGVRPHNADSIVKALEVNELHSSATQGWAAWRREDCRAIPTYDDA